MGSGHSVQSKSWLASQARGGEHVTACAGVVLLCGRDAVLDLLIHVALHRRNDLLRHDFVQEYLRELGHADPGRAVSPKLSMSEYQLQLTAGQHGQGRARLITLSMALLPARSLQSTSVPRLAARSATPSTGFIGGAIKPL
jgi:hypothetical protein